MILLYKSYINQFFIFLLHSRIKVIHIFYILKVFTKIILCTVLSCNTDLNGKWQITQVVSEFKPHPRRLQMYK